MNKLLDLHYQVQKGMYFDFIEKRNKFEIYTSKFISDSFWNYAYIDSKIDLNSFGSLVFEINDYFNRKGKNSGIYLTEKDKDFKRKVEFLVHLGYECVSKESFMVYTLSNVDSIFDLKNKIKFVKSDIEKKQFLDVFIEAYGGEKSPDQPYGELSYEYIDSLLRSFNEPDKFIHAILYDDNNAPISVATLCIYGLYGGLYNIGTKPKYRGCGFGTLITKALISYFYGNKGSTLFLQTETGSNVEKLYKKIGFSTEFVGSVYFKEIV